jgi:MoxR-like ATPase
MNQESFDQMNNAGAGNMQNNGFVNADQINQASQASQVSQVSQTNGPSVSQEDLLRANGIYKALMNYYGQRIVGQENLGISLLIALIANGHVLLESVPGLAKTTAAKIITNAVSGKFSRVQCTPDLLPSDIIGGQIFNYSTNNFETRLGPVFANFVLLDEINRSSAKTQSAMLEAMQERQTTIGGELYKMPEVFIVIATQNPIEQEGTYALAEAQMDRFLIKEKLVYPSAEEEVVILDRLEKDVFNDCTSILTLDDVTFLQNTAKKIYVDRNVKRYITELVDATRYPQNYIAPELCKYVTMGASTRASISFLECAKAVALMNGRGYVTPDDVKAVAYRVLRHRITLSFAALAEDVSSEVIIDAILKVVPTP